MAGKVYRVLKESTKGQEDDFLARYMAHRAAPEATCPINEAKGSDVQVSAEAEMVEAHGKPCPQKERT